MKKKELIQRIKNLINFHNECDVQCDLDDDIMTVLEEDEKDEKDES